MVSFKKKFDWLKKQLRKKPFNISNWVTERPTLWENNLPAYLVHMAPKRDMIMPGPFISESRVYNLQFQAESEWWWGKWYVQEIEASELQLGDD